MGDSARIMEGVLAKRNENKLSVIFDKRQKDFVVSYPRRPDGNLAMYHIVNDRLDWKLPSESDKSYPFNYEKFNFVKELESRGYDITTLKFSIELRKE